jgi:hypothetical protein
MYTRDITPRGSKIIEPAQDGPRPGSAIVAQRGEPLLLLEIESASPVYGNPAFSNS